MLKKDIKVGGEYTATVSGQRVTVKVDSISIPKRYAGTGRATTHYQVTNLRTGNKLTFRSAARFQRAVAMKEVPVLKYVGGAPLSLEHKQIMNLCGDKIAQAVSDAMNETGGSSTTAGQPATTTEDLEVPSSFAQGSARIYGNTVE